MPAPVDKMTNKQAARYIVELADAGEDCRYKLGAVSRILRQAK